MQPIFRPILIGCMIMACPALALAAAEPDAPAPPAAPDEALAPPPSPTAAPPPVPIIGDDGRPSTIPADAAVAIIRVDGMIYDFTLDSISRRIERAREEGAEVIVLELDTPGGVVTSALKISKYLKALDLPTVAWVNNEAYSAGIMIASACDAIVMARSSATGDCAPVTMTGSLSPTERAKALSPILEEFRDSAEQNGYDYAMFHAMCVLGVEVYQIEHKETGERRLVNQADYHVMVNGLTRDQAHNTVAPAAAPPPSLKIEENEVKIEPGFSLDRVTVDIAKDEDRGQWQLVEQVHDGVTLLTINQTRAEKIGLSRSTVSNASEIDQWLSAAQTWRIKLSWSEQLVKWLTHPAVRSVMVVAVLLGAYMEFQSPGLGLPGAVAGIALIVLLGSPFLIGLSEFWHIIAFFAGFVCLMIEIFVLPGFGIFGILGLLLMFAGLVFSMPGAGSFNLPGRAQMSAVTDSFIATTIGFAVAGGGVIAMIYYFGRLPIFNRLILDTAQPTRTQAAVAARAADATSALAGEPAPADTSTAAPTSARPDTASLELGTTGHAVSELRPVGRAEINDQLLDVVTLGEWIAPGRDVRVIEIHGNRIVVEPA